MLSRKGDEGAIAVLSALLALVLIGVSALAVDLSNLWATRREARTSADSVVLAAATKLPSVAAARATALDYLQRNKVNGEVWPACPGPISATSPACWDNDGDFSNGEIDFFRADSGGDGYSSADLTTGNDAVAVRVALPRRQVNFALAGALGFNKGFVSAAATAEIRSPGSGSLPFYVTPSDYGMRCLKDDSGGPGRTSGEALREALLVPPMSAPTGVAVSPPATGP